MVNNNKRIHILSAASGLTFKLMHIADQQVFSWYNKQEYPKKECDFCKFSQAEEKLMHSLVKTDVSLFAGHELLVAPVHGGEYIGVHLKHMLNIVDENNKAAIAFEGSKNAPIKNYHFSCHYISDKSHLLITADIHQTFFEEVISQDNVSFGIFNVHGRNPICIKSPSADTIINAFHELENHIGVNYSTNDHPYINLVMWKEGQDYILIAIPRAVYKPTEFYDENNSWNIAPGVLEMSGLYLIPDHSEPTSFKPEQLEQINAEVSFNNSHILEILNELDLSNI
ncbi:hypothetical protein [Carboxylicivirga sp. RSCT41]|uniref:hypothetical protein n=1 Tax=Carboxylicivirga agarovorans TaxID=3417570 RepID=UPI003D32DF8F